MEQKKSTVNIILGISSFAAAAAMAVDTAYFCNKYSDIAKPDDIRSFCIFMIVGIIIMVIIGAALLKSRKHDPYKRIAMMLVLLLAAGYGTACLNSMLRYVAVTPQYYETHQNR